MYVCLCIFKIIILTYHIIYYVHSKALILSFKVLWPNGNMYINGIKRRFSSFSIHTWYLNKFDLFLSVMIS